MSELLARLRGSWEGLAPRERVTVGAASAVLFVSLVFFGMVQPLLDASSDAARRLETAEEQLRAVQELRTRYDDVQARLGGVESRIRSGPQGEIFTTLEKLAQQSAVKIDSVEPRTSPASDEFRETRVQVALRGVTLAQFVNYLHRIESAPQLLSIKTLRIRTRADAPELLDVTFTVSSFEPIG